MTCRRAVEQHTRLVKYHNGPFLIVNAGAIEQLVLIHMLKLQSEAISPFLLLSRRVPPYPLIKPKSPRYE